MKTLISCLVFYALAVASLSHGNEWIREVRETKEIIYCAPTTPCGWSIFTRFEYQGIEYKIINLNISSPYCLCVHGSSCRLHYELMSGDLYVHHCLPDPTEEPMPESTTDQTMTETIEPTTQS